MQNTVVIPINFMKFQTIFTSSYWLDWIPELKKIAIWSLFFTIKFISYGSFKYLLQDEIILSMADSQ